MLKQLLLGTAMALATVGIATAAPISGSFSLAVGSGDYVGGTALTATGLDFGYAVTDPANTGNGTGNGYGTNGSALVTLANGSFASYNLTYASIADIALAGTVGNPYTTNPFITLGGSKGITVSFSNALVTRSPSGTSVTVAGTATFMDGIAADATSGIFSLAADSQSGSPASMNLTFTSNVSATPSAVPEPMSLALLGTSLVGLGVARRKRA